MGRPPEVVHRPVAGAERLGVLNGSLQEGPRFPGRLERLFSARQARHYGRRERAAGAVSVGRVDPLTRQDFEGAPVEDQVIRTVSLSGRP